MCCDPWGRKESDTTERLNSTELHDIFLTQRSNPHLLHLLHWQADSLPQSHRRSLLNGSFSDKEFYYFLLANRDTMVLKQIIVP